MAMERVDGSMTEGAADPAAIPVLLQCRDQGSFRDGSTIHSGPWAGITDFRIIPQPHLHSESCSDQEAAFQEEIQALDLHLPLPPTTLADLRAASAPAMMHTPFKLMPKAGGGQNSMLISPSQAEGNSSSGGGQQWKAPAALTTQDSITPALFLEAAQSMMIPDRQGLNQAPKSQSSWKTIGVAGDVATLPRPFFASFTAPRRAAAISAGTGGGSSAAISRPVAHPRLHPSRLAQRSFLPPAPILEVDLPADAAAAPTHEVQAHHGVVTHGDPQRGGELLFPRAFTSVAPVPDPCSPRPHSIHASSGGGAAQSSLQGRPGHIGELKQTHSMMAVTPRPHPAHSNLTAEVAAAQALSMEAQAWRASQALINNEAPPCPIRTVGVGSAGFTQGTVPAPIRQQPTTATNNNRVQYQHVVQLQEGAAGFHGGDGVSWAGAAANGEIVHELDSVADSGSTGGNSRRGATAPEPVSFSTSTQAPMSVSVSANCVLSGETSAAVTPWCEGGAQGGLGSDTEEEEEEVAQVSQPAPQPEAGPGLAQQHQFIYLLPRLEEEEHTRMCWLKVCDGEKEGCAHPP